MSKFPPATKHAARSAAGGLTYEDYFFDEPRWNAASQAARNAACDIAGQPRVPPPLMARQQAARARRTAMEIREFIASLPGKLAEAEAAGDGYRAMVLRESISKLIPS